VSSLDAAFWGGLAASSLPAGAALAMRAQLSSRVTGAIMGFGGGALISSIAYELVPESRLAHGAWAMGLWFAAGALTFFVGDWIIDRCGGAHRKKIEGARVEGSGMALFMGTLLDGVPESLILGIGLATGGSIGMAFLASVFVSNLPEGIAGTDALVAAGSSRRRVMEMWLGLVAASAAASAAGYAFVVHVPAADGRYASAFAGGAVLTMLSDVMMPEAFEHGGRPVGLLATLGFLTAAALAVAE